MYLLQNNILNNFKVMGVMFLLSTRQESFQGVTRLYGMRCDVMEIMCDWIIGVMSVM